MDFIMVCTFTWTFEYLSRDLIDVPEQLYLYVFHVGDAIRLRSVCARLFYRYSLTSDGDTRSLVDWIADFHHFFTDSVPCVSSLSLYNHISEYSDTCMHI